MKTLVFLVCALSLNAQITATLHTSPEGAPEIRIRNDTPVPLVAFAILVTDTNGVIDGPMAVYADSAIDPTETPLSPKQEYPVKFGRAVMRNGIRTYSIPALPLVTAGVFADGSSTGDQALLNRLILRRCNMLQAVELSLEILMDAGRRNVPRDQLIGQFRRLANSLDHWYLPPEQQVGRGLYSSIIGKLLNLPDLPLGSPFPPTPFVEQETASLTRQRAILVDSQPSLTSVQAPEGK